MINRYLVWFSGTFACIALVLAFGALDAGCAGNKAPILVGNSGLAVAQTIGQVQQAVRNLTETNVITAPQALQIQERLLKINDQLKPLPDILRTIDKLQMAGSSTQASVDQAIAILKVVGQGITVVVGGVPVSEITEPLIKFVLAAQDAVQTTLVEVAKLKGGQ